MPETVAQTGTEESESQSQATQTETTETQPEKFDPTPYAGNLVTVKVDGEEVEVPLSEALGGYMRQAHFTKATQSLAEQREAAEFGASIAALMETNAKAGLDYLKQLYEVSDEETEPPTEEQQWKTKTEQELADLRQARVLAEVRDEFDALKAKNGGDLGVTFEELLQYAAENDAKSLEFAWRARSFEPKATEQKPDPAKERKQALPPSAGGSNADGSVTSTQQQKAAGLSTREQLRASLRAALTEHGQAL